MKPNNMIYLKCTDDSFFRTWVEFLGPFHKLSSRERDVMARVIAQYFKFQDKVRDPSLLNEMLWTHASRKDMRESLGMSPAHFQVILGRLRDASVLLENDMINPRYLPHIGEEPRFMLSIVFDWSSKQNPINVKEQG